MLQSLSLKLPIALLAYDFEVELSVQEKIFLVYEGCRKGRYLTDDGDWRTGIMQQELGTNYRKYVGLLNESGVLETLNADETQEYCFQSAPILKNISKHKAVWI